MLYKLTRKTANAKVRGYRSSEPMATTMTGKDSCPAACPFKGNGCYAENWPLSRHWRRLSDGETGDALDAFLDQIRALPAGYRVRHNVAGDLPGKGNRIDARAFRRLDAACAGKRVFTYTHKPPSPSNLAVLAGAKHITVNLSANNLAHADALAAHGLPVCAVVETDAATTPAYTPGGRKVVVCPAVTRDDIGCGDCMLCAVSSRKSVVAFPVHGARKRAAASACKGEPK